MILLVEVHPSDGKTKLAVLELVYARSENLEVI